MKKIETFLLFIVLLGMQLLFVNLNAQTLHFEWAKQLGGTEADIGSAMAIDASGNIYTVGNFKDTADFDPGTDMFDLVSAGLMDVFISKINASGNFEWAKQLGGINDEYGNSVALDAAGNVYIIGRFEGTVDFDPGIGIFNMTSAGSFDVFVCKLDDSGNFIWAKQLGGTGNDLISSIAVDAESNAYTTGYFSGTSDFDPGTGIFNLTSAGSSDIFISKLDASGNFMWARQLGGVSFDNSQCITLDSAGNVYTTGYFSGTSDFDPGAGTFNLTSAGDYDVFISKLDASGNLVLAKQLGGIGSDLGYSIAVDAAGNIYTTGSFQEIADFDPGTGIFNLGSSGYQDIFVSKLDVSGNIIWAKQLGGIEEDCSNSIAVDASGNVYITGYFIGIADFDPGTGTHNLTSAGDKDVFISKLNTSGNIVFAEKLGGTAEDYSTSLVVDASGNVFTIGSFQALVDFDPGFGTFNLTTAGYKDVFIQKMSQPVSDLVENSFGSGVNVFPNPSTGEFTIDLGAVYKDVCLEAINATGQVIMRKQPGDVQTISLELIESKGIYIITILASTGERALIRVIKE